MRSWLLLTVSSTSHYSLTIPPRLLSSSFSLFSPQFHNFHNFHNFFLITTSPPIQIPLHNSSNLYSRYFHLVHATSIFLHALSRPPANGLRSPSSEVTSPVSSAQSSPIPPTSWSQNLIANERLVCLLSVQLPPSSLLLPLLTLPFSLPPGTPDCR
jgi:hypothetical protein